MVATYAAMKSGLKGPPRGTLLIDSRSSNLCRDEKRTERASCHAKAERLRSVATYAAMKSGLKVDPGDMVSKTCDGSNLCRDEKRTESTSTLATLPEKLG